MDKKDHSLPKRLVYFTMFLTLGWSIATGVALMWNIVQNKEEGLRIVRQVAKSHFDKDVLYREWNALHGGVYAPVTDTTKPNPYLDITLVPERDITTPGGRKLTLINPAYMTRQSHELALKKYEIKGHITSLTPIRPENAPDEWEKRALEAFEQGENEFSEVITIEHKEHMRFMRPLFTKKGCLKCHAQQGYKEGDIRGGISITVPMDEFSASTSQHLNTIWLGYLFLWLLGVCGIGFGFLGLQKRITERRRMELALETAHDELEQRVIERTAELTASNIQLEGARDELLKANIKLQELDKAKSEFLNSVSHELRTPLTSVMGFAMICRKKFHELAFTPDEKSADHTKALINQVDHNIEIMVEEGKKLTALITDVLNITRMETGKVKWQMGPVSVAELIRWAMSSTSHLFQTDELILVDDIEPDLPMIEGDSERLVQALIRLITNAQKFTVKGQVTCKAVQEDDYIIVSIIDTGVGIAPENVHTIFDKFTQIENVRTGKPSGTGLGLYITQQVIKHHGGKIWVESEFGKGSTFFFTLPVYDENAVNNDEPITAET